jgi:hypothetical protein
MSTIVQKTVRNFLFFVDTNGFDVLAVQISSDCKRRCCTSKHCKTVALYVDKDEFPVLMQEYSVSYETRCYNEIELIVYSKQQN